MEKNRSIHGLSPCVLKMLKIMKLTVFLMLISFIGVFASETYSQTTKLSLKVEKISLEDFLVKIENQSEFHFFYTAKINVEQEVSGEFRNQKIFEILDEIKDEAGFQYEVLGRQIILSPNDAEGAIKSIQQQKTVSGTVTDEAGQPLPGVTVVVKGTTQGTVTNADGDYSLSNIPENATLVFSFVGMLTQEIVIGSQTIINVEMVLDAIGIEEVVAIGYGTVKKSDLTGAVSSIKSEDLPLMVNTNVTQMLSGKASGVQIRQNSAQPGGGMEIFIRGAASTGAGNAPLYVIDGFPISNESVEPSGGRYEYGSRNPLNTINPNDIESIEILKDASATAIYGARAANGVILINTKRGTQGINVTYKGSQSFQTITNYVDQLNAEELMTFHNKISKEEWMDANNIAPYGNTDPATVTPFIPSYSDSDISSAGKGTDWFNLVSRTGKIQEHNLSISGGSDKTKFFSSFNYYDQQGVVINSALKRISGRLNIDQKITDKFAIGVNLTLSQVDNSNSQLGGNIFGGAGVLGAAMAFPSIFPVYDDEGNYTKNYLFPETPNPMSYREITDNTLTRRLLTNTFAELEIVKNFKARISLGMDVNSSERDTYMPKAFMYGEQVGGQANKGLNKLNDYLIDYLLTYNNVFGQSHNLTAIAGYSYQKFTQDGFSAEATNFFTDAFLTNQLQVGSNRPEVASYKSESILASYFGRVNYSYDNRYIVAVTSRLDGSDRFGVHNKYSFFPSVAIGWNMHHENFMKKNAFLSKLKLRASLGQTGNANIGGNAFAFYDSGYTYQFGDKIYTGVQKTQVENPNLKWETTTELNLGLDFGFWDNRLSGSFEYYNKTVSDLLYQQNLQYYSEVSSIWMNIGSTQSKGTELQIEGHILTGELKWNTTLNLSQFNDRWKERAPDALRSLSPWVDKHDYIRPVYNFVFDGIVQPGESIPHMPNVRPGNVKVKDVNGFQKDQNEDFVLDADGRRVLTGEPDGILDDADRAFLGKSDPDLIFGFGNTFNFRNFDLNVFFDGKLNYVVYDDNMLYVFLQLLTHEGQNLDSKVKDAWFHDNQDGIYPGAAVNPYEGVVWDAQNYRKISFARLRNVTLGYTFPEKIWSTKIRLFVDVQNLLTITNYDGVDPEADGMHAYPNQKSFTIGLNVNF